MSTTSPLAQSAPIASRLGLVPAPLRSLWRRADAHGWLVLLLTFLIGIYLPSAITDINWIDDVSLLWPVCLIAIAVGILVASTGIRDLRRFLLAWLAGLLGVYLADGQVIPSPGRLAYDLRDTIRWIATRGAGVPAGHNPPAEMLRAGLAAAGVFGDHLITWWRLGGFGEASIDNRIFLFLLAVISWTVLLYFAWALYSHVTPIITLLPPGVVLITFVVLGGQGAPYVYLYLVTALVIILRVHVLSLVQSWNQRNLDYPASVGFEVLATGLLFTLFVGGLAIILPALPQNPLAVRFWTVFNAPWSALESNVGEAFTGVRHRVGGDVGNDLNLGGAISFGENQIIFDAYTDEPPPPTQGEHDLEDLDIVIPEHYFMAETYADYNGSGWQLGKTAGVSRTGVPIGPNGVPNYLGVGSGSTSTQSRPASVPIIAAPPGDRVVQRIQKVSDTSNLMYGYNAEVSVNVPYTVQTTGGSPDRIELPRGTRSYTVVSVEADPSAQDLRADSTSYPTSLAPYLARPNVPARVDQLAVQWAAGATNPYDKAMNIEAQLRKIPYSTDIIPPPPGRDAVDYFLFTLKRGYCEYYASAMVVMLREVGVPSRIVTGYATTTYNQAQNDYEISDNDAHAWVQVYFPTYGWLDFEPTPVNPELIRPDNGAGEVPVLLPNPPESNVGIGQRLPVDPRVLIGVAVALLAALVAWVIRRQWEAELATADYVRLVYDRMVRWSGRFGVPKRRDETPLEFAQRLSERFALTAEPVAVAILQIATLFVLAQYAHRSLGLPERNQAVGAWQTMRTRLWRLRRIPVPLTADERA